MSWLSLCCLLLLPIVALVFGNWWLALGVCALLLVYFVVELGWGGGKREHGRSGMRFW